MLLNSEILKTKFDQGLSYDTFVASCEADGHRMKWDQRFDLLALTEQQQSLVQSFTREINVLCLTGSWCGDCALQGSAMARIANANTDRIHLRYLPKTDEHADLIVKCQINGGFRVPVTWFMAEDFQPVSRFGDRTLSRYRSMAGKQLPPGAAVIIADPPADPVRSVLDEVLAEFERVHLLLRLSSRLRSQHDD